MSACRPTYGKNLLEEVILYESPTSSCSDIESRFVPNLYVNISDYIEEKIKIFKECYKIQHTEVERKNLSSEGIIKHSIYRGYECGLNNVESFKIIKKIIL
jgi:hypothetical protein